MEWHKLGNKIVSDFTQLCQDTSNPPDLPNRDRDLRERNSAAGIVCHMVVRLRRLNSISRLSVRDRQSLNTYRGFIQSLLSKPLSTRGIKKRQRVEEDDVSPTTNDNAKTLRKDFDKNPMGEELDRLTSFD